MDNRSDSTQVTFGGGQTFRAVMSDLFATPTVQVVIGLLVLSVLIRGALYLLSSFRDYTAEDKEPINGALSNLEEMHLKGDISDEEFRTILATTRRELNRLDVIDESAPGETSP